MKKALFIMGGIAASSAFSSLLSSSLASPYMGKLVVLVQSYQVSILHRSSSADLAIIGSMTEIEALPLKPCQSTTKAPATSALTACN